MEPSVPTRKHHHWLLRSLMALSLTTPFVVSQITPAHFRPEDLVATVEIDGVPFGTFDKVDGIEDVLKKPSGQSLRVTFKRDFVTEPSLYLWAKNVVQGHPEPRQIDVLYSTPDGDEVKRIVLHQTQPLSWTVESSSPSLGGFYEAVEFAVQDVSVP